MIRIQASHGGRLNLITKHDKTISINATTVLGLHSMRLNISLTPFEIILRTNPHFAHNVVDRYYMNQGGSFRTEGSIGQWADTVAEKPVIIRGKRLELRDFFQPDANRSEIYNAMGEALKAEREFQLLRRYRTVMDKLHVKSQIKDLLMDPLDSELRFITPNSDIIPRFATISDLVDPLTSYTINATTPMRHTNRKS
jgi:hypothetical protein